VAGLGWSRNESGPVAARKSVEIFLGVGNLYHASFKQTRTRLPTPLNCVQMIDRCGRPFAHGTSGVVL
jgi:hypothetical protein